MADDDATYLGDGVFAKWDGNGVTVSTPREDTFRGSVDHWIYFEADTLAALIEFWNRSRGQQEDNPRE